MRKVISLSFAKVVNTNVENQLNIINFNHIILWIYTKCNIFNNTFSNVNITQSNTIKKSL